MGSVHRRNPRRVIRHVPDDVELYNLPMVRPGEYELSERETVRLRRRIYSLNRNNVLFKWRTVREGPILLIWRLEK